jgi:hypothetical protein
VPVNTRQKRTTLKVKINTNRKVEAQSLPNGDICLRFTKDRNKHTYLRLTRKATEATVTLLIAILNGALKDKTNETETV